MLKLRKMREEDIYKVMEWRSLPEVTRYMYTDITPTRESQKAWFDRVSASDAYLYWIIEIEGTDIGVINLYDIDRTNSRAFWAYYIADTSFRGRGIARNLECNIYDFVFDTLGLDKLCCEVFEDNDKVVQIHQKFGSKIEGTFINHIKKNGEWKNIVRMAILKNDWYAIRPDHEYQKIDIEE